MAASSPILLPGSGSSVVCSQARWRTLGDVIRLAGELAREGREGRRLGALFIVGDVNAVLARSRSLVLDPLIGHAPELRHVRRPEFAETVKELAQLDGAFLVDDDGVFTSAARLVDVDVARLRHLPSGLGARHAAAASISSVTHAVAVVVSQSSVVRVFAAGHRSMEIVPERLLDPGVPGAVETVRVRVKRAYLPSTVVALAGRELELIFRREERSLCSSELLFPAFDATVALPTGRDVALRILPHNPGEYGFLCRRGVLRGRLLVVAACDERELHEPAKPLHNTFTSVAQAPAIGP